MERLIALNDVLRAWQAGRIRYRDAMRRAGAETLDELYDAAWLSRVPLRAEMLPEEREQASRVAPIIRAAAKRGTPP